MSLKYHIITVQKRYKHTEIYIGFQFLRFHAEFFSCTSIAHFMNIIIVPFRRKNWMLWIMFYTNFTKFKWIIVYLQSVPNAQFTFEQIRIILASTTNCQSIYISISTQFFQSSNAYIALAFQVRQ